MNHATCEHRAQQAEDDLGKQFRLESAAQHNRLEIGYGLRTFASVYALAHQTARALGRSYRQREHKQPGAEKTAQKGVQLGGGEERTIHLHGRKQQYREDRRQHQRGSTGDG